MRELKGILHLGQKDRFYTSPQPYPVASRDVALKSKQEQKAKTIQQKGINLLLCARMCDRADIRRAEGLKNRRMIVSKDSFGHSSPTVPHSITRCCTKIEAGAKTIQQKDINTSPLRTYVRQGRYPKGRGVKKQKNDSVKRFLRTLLPYRTPQHHEMLH